MCLCTWDPSTTLADNATRRGAARRGFSSGANPLWIRRRCGEIRRGLFMQMANGEWRRIRTKLIPRSHIGIARSNRQNGAKIDAHRASERANERGEGVFWDVKFRNTAEGIPIMHYVRPQQQQRSPSSFAQFGWRHLKNSVEEKPFWIRKIMHFEGQFPRPLCRRLA